MAHQLIVPVTSVSPAGGGTCTAVGGAITNPFIVGQYQPYTYTATPAAGYRFVRFEIETIVSSSDSPDEPHSRIVTNNPHTAAWDNLFNGSTWWFDHRNYGGREVWVSSLTVTAVFELIHIPTHLLVWDDTPGGSGLLVYDDRTGSNELVADY